MKRISAVTLIAVAFLVLPLVAQEKEKAKEATPSMAMPKPLSENEFLAWMVGEWEGSAVSPFGKTKEWQKLEWGLDNQFLMMTGTSQTTEMTPEQMKMASEAMNMSMEDLRKMRDMVYKGMGPLTVNPMNGEYVGFWFDSMRGTYRGAGKLQGSKLAMDWKPLAGEGTPGGESRTIERLGADKMVLIVNGIDAKGKAWETRIDMTRKKGK